MPKEVKHLLFFCNHILTLKSVFRNIPLTEELQHRPLTINRNFGQRQTFQIFTFFERERRLLISNKSLAYMQAYHFIYPILANNKVKDINHTLLSIKHQAVYQLSQSEANTRKSCKVLQFLLK